MIRPNASLPELLANRDWIHDLARSIVADEHVRDDVVQDAWLTAWRTDTPPTRDARGWLATVVRNFARQRARSEARRTRRERAAARPEAQIPATSLTERAELQQRAVAAVLALPEPGRTLLLERFFEGLDPKALAARHDCPIETIRTRLKTALARVRAKLEREDRAGAWRALVIASPASAWPLAATAGVLLMTMKTKVALTAVGLLLAGGFLYPTLAGPEPAETAVEPDAASAMIASTTPTEQPADRGTAPPAREDAALPATPELHARLDGLRAGVPWTTRVEMKFDGRDAAGKACTFEQLASFDAAACVVALPAWLRDPQRVHLEVRANDPSYATRHWEFGAEALQTTRERPLLLQAQCAAIITGRVECSEPAPIKVAAYPIHDGQPTQQPSENVRCDQESAYRLRVPDDGPYLIVAVATGSPLERSFGEHRPRVDLLPGATRVMATVGQRLQAPLIRIGKGHHLTGRALRSDGRPLGNAGLTCELGGDAQLFFGDTRLTWHADDRIGRTDSRARTNVDGRFEFDGLPSLEHFLRVDEVPGAFAHLFALAEFVTPPADVELSLAATELTLDVWTGGAPSPSARVSMQGNKTTIELGPLPSPVRILAAYGGSYDLEVSADGFEPQTFEWSPAKPEERRLVELRRAPRRVVAFALQGDSFGRARFEAQPLDTGAEAFVRDTEKTDRHLDRFVFHDLPAGRFRITVQPSATATGGDRYLVETTLDIDIPQAGEISLPLRLQAGGPLRLRATAQDGLDGRCEIFDANGTRVPMTFTRRTDWGQINSTDGELLPGGPNDSARNLPPGRYRVEVRRSNGRLQTFAVDIVAGEASELVVN